MAQVPSDHMFHAGLLRRSLLVCSVLSVFLPACVCFPRRDRDQCCSPWWMRRDGRQQTEFSGTPSLQQPGSSLEVPEVYTKSNLYGIKCSQSVSQILSGLLLSVSAVEHWKSSKFTLAFDSFLEAWCTLSNLPLTLFCAALWRCQGCLFSCAGVYLSWWNKVVLLEVIKKHLTEQSPTPVLDRTRDRQGDSNHDRTGWIFHQRLCWCCW